MVINHAIGVPWLKAIQADQLVELGFLWRGLNLDLHRLVLWVVVKEVVNAFPHLGDVGRVEQKVAVAGVGFGAEFAGGLL